MAEQIVIIGAGGFGRETLDVVEAINAASPAPVWEVLGVMDDGDAASAHAERVRQRGYVLLGGFDDAIVEQGAHYVVGIGSPATRRAVVARAESRGWSAATLLHPTATIGSRVTIAAGSVVCGGVQVSTNVVLGEHVHLNPGAVIGHDARLEEYVSVNPGAIISGEVIVGRDTLIGAGAVILQGLTVGTGALVGAAACVTRSVSAGTTVKGVPAR